MVFHLGTLMPSAREAPPSCRLPPITDGRRSYHLLCFPSVLAIERHNVDEMSHGPVSLSSPQAVPMLIYPCGRLPSPPFVVCHLH